jgi:putative Mg2+ transporter-C (MgtC) family protein
MRLPLGILSGVGFIGAGTILRRGNKVEGVTTAATLWFVTVIGLCFGGGQYLLGLGSTALALVVATIFRIVEPSILPWRRGKVTARVTRAAEAALDEIVRAAGVVVLSRHIVRDVAKAMSTIDFEVRYSLRGLSKPAQILDRLETCEDVARASWEDEIR